MPSGGAWLFLKSPGEGTHTSQCSTMRSTAQACYGLTVAHHSDRTRCRFRVGWREVPAAMQQLFSTQTAMSAIWCLQVSGVAYSKATSVASASPSMHIWIRLGLTCSSTKRYVRPPPKSFQAAGPQSCFMLHFSLLIICLPKKNQIKSASGRGWTGCSARTNTSSSRLVLSTTAYALR